MGGWWVSRSYEISSQVRSLMLLPSILLLQGAVRATGEGDGALEFEADFLQDPPV